MKVLITGGAGFIGSHLADRYLEEGWEVRVMDSLQPRVHPFGLPKHIPKNVEFVKGDVTNREDWEKALAGVDCVSHQAAYQDYVPDYGWFSYVNVFGTALLDAPSASGTEPGGDAGRLSRAESIAMRHHGTG